MVGLEAVLSFLKDESMHGTNTAVARMLYDQLRSAKTLMFLHGVTQLLETLQHLTKHLQHEFIR